MRKFISAALCAVTFCLILTVCSCKKTPTENICRLDLHYDSESGVLSGKAAYKFVNSSNEVLNEIKFNLAANAYNGKNEAVSASRKDSAYYLGESLGGIKILSCKTGEKPLQFSLSENELTLCAAFGELFPDEEAEIEIEFETTLPKANLRLGITENAVNLADSYPTLCKLSENGFVETNYSPFGDPYFSDVFDFSANVDVPSEFTAACSGSPEKTVIDGDRTTYSFSMKNGRYFAFVLSDKFNVSAVKSGNTDIYYYSVAPENGKLAEVKKCFDYFSSEFGEYPYKTFSVAETGLFCGGMEFSGLCFIADALEDEEKINAARHETAHEWWGTTVGNNQLADAYVDEGLAEYSAYLYLLFEGKNDEAEEMINNAKAAYKSFFDIKSIFSGSANTVMNRPLNEFLNEEEYVAIAYRKSLVMFSELEKTVGAKKNVSSLKKLYRDNKFKNIGFNELTKAFGREEYFRSFVSGKVIV